jgi:hypothetical protein
MRKLALAIAASMALVAALFVSPIGAFATTSNHSPTVVGPHSGARSAFPHPSSGRIPAAVPRTVTLTCDAGFHTVSSPNSVNHNYLVSTSAVSANDVWAVGNTSNVGVAYDQPLAEHWDGSNWTIVPMSDPGPYHVDLTGVVAISTNDVWVVGIFVTAADNSTESSYAQHWNGSSWSGYVLAPTSVTAVFAVAASSSTDVWAVGTFLSANTLEPMVEHWNGSAWSLSPGVMNANSFDNEFFSVSALSSTDVWVVGEDTASFGVSPQSLAEHWDGSTWTLPATPNSAGDNEILGVAALGAGHAVGIGFGNFINGTSRRQSQSWDLVAGGISMLNATIGTGFGSGDNALLGIARSGGAVIAVGYQRPGGNTTPRLTLDIPANWDAGANTFTWLAAAQGDNPGAVNTVFEAVSAVSPYAFWATGYENNNTTFDQTLTEAYCADQFNVTAPVSATSGSAFSVTVTVQTGAGTTVMSYRGTVHFTSSDGTAVLPANYTFLAGDNGTHTFAGVIIHVAGNQTITVNDLAMPFTTPGTATVRVLCSGTCQSSGGSPGNRITGGSPATTAAGRTGALPGPSGTPGPRLPRLGSLAEGSSVGMSLLTTAAGLASVKSSVAAAPQSAPQTGGAALIAMSSDSVQAPAHLTISLAARNERLSRPSEPSMWYLLLLACLLGGLLTIGEFRRRRFKEKSNVRIRP